ncbi:MAG: sporulation integral membrane protein YtvI [Oscillospiraceae bacterium]|nr:sporulation integral membrane protein YtvI [Oscillospiraceae bacterium]
MRQLDWKKYALPCALGIAALVLFWNYLLPVFWPFLIGALVAKAVEPIVRFLIRKGGFPRALAAGGSVLALYLAVGLVLWMIVRRSLYELGALSGALPELLASAAKPLGQVHQWLRNLASTVPDGLGDVLRSWVDGLFQSSETVMSGLGSNALHAATAVIGWLPTFFLFSVTSVLSSIFFAAEKPQLLRFLHETLPDGSLGRVKSVVQLLRQALGGWILAQLKLMGITFVLITAGLFILRFDYALLFGALIALIDALPVFGTGTILIPWGLIMFVRGNPRCGIGLLVLYGVTALTRTALEPRFIGKQIGLSPLLTLFALYCGYQLAGIGGMILFPIAAMMLKQLYEYRRSRKP